MAESINIELSVIVPARNEEACLRDCLTSLTAQSDEGFKLGRDWDLIVVNDESIDATRSIAASYGGVTVIDAPALLDGWTGKNNAVWAGAEASHGRWLLFTDADTVHEPGGLGRALHEAKKYNAAGSHGVAMLSYSPRQQVSGVLQRMVMPLIFSELAAVYKPKDISNPEKRIAAANGQFLLIEREAYFAVGGHKAVAASVLEDVDLARKIKRAKYIVRFRYGPDAVTARMYRSFGQMVEGWTKNLALLFPQPLALAAWRLLDLALLAGLPLIALGMWFNPMPTPWWAPLLLLLLWLRTLVRVYMRIAKSHFSWIDCAIAPLGIPIFSWLLARSWTRHTFGKRVGWKGRSYPTR
jgi:glycosyltransferase involved in cell wall biosynthesis